MKLTYKLISTIGQYLPENDPKEWASFKLSFARSNSGAVTHSFIDSLTFVKNDAKYIETLFNNGLNTTAWFVLFNENVEIERYKISFVDYKKTFYVNNTGFEITVSLISSGINEKVAAREDYEVNMYEGESVNGSVVSQGKDLLIDVMPVARALNQSAMLSFVDLMSRHTALANEMQPEGWKCNLWTFLQKPYVVRGIGSTPAMDEMNNHSLIQWFTLPLYVNDNKQEIINSSYTSQAISAVDRTGLYPGENNTNNLMDDPYYFWPVGYPAYFPDTSYFNSYENSKLTLDNRVFERYLEAGDEFSLHIKAKGFINIKMNAFWGDRHYNFFSKLRIKSAIAYKRFPFKGEFGLFDAQTIWEHDFPYLGYGSKTYLNHPVELDYNHEGFITFDNTVVFHFLIFEWTCGSAGNETQSQCEPYSFAFLDFTDASLNVSFFNRRKDVATFKALRVSDAFKVITENITDNTNTFVSDYFTTGAGKNICLTKGSWLRNSIDTDKKVWKMAYKKLFDNMNACFATGQIYEQNKLRIEGSNKVYDTSKITDLQNWNNLIEQFTSEYSYSNLKFGSTKGTTEKCISTLPHCLTKYQTGINYLNGTLEKTTEFITNPDLFELCRRDTGADSSDYDDDIFLFEIKDESHLGTFYELELTAMSDVFDPTTVFNGNLTPVKMMLNHSHLISTCLWNSGYNTLLFVSNENDSKAGWVSGIYTFYENTSYPITFLNSKKFIPLTAEIDLPFTQPIINSIKENGNGLFRLTIDNIRYYAYLVEGSGNMTKENEGKLKLILCQKS